MPRAVSVETMRKSDAWTIANKVSSKELMRRAGEGIYRAVEWKAPVAILCGKGNNAGDGYVVADLLHRDGIDCTIILIAEKFSEDGQYYFDICREHGIPFILYEEGMDLSRYATILDCLLGTGFSGDVRGIMKEAIESVNHASGSAETGRDSTYVVSADINSGLNGDTGMGTTFVRSNLTVSIGDYKFGHFKGLAGEAMKSKVNVDIGIEIQGEIVEL